VVEVERHKITVYIPCDGEDKTHGDTSMPYPHGLRACFSAFALSSALRRARKVGWRVSMRGRSLCPECKKNERHHRVWVRPRG
jgi:hypothetical protein